MLYFIIIIAFIFESIVSLLVPLNSFLSPLLVVSSLVLIYPYFMNDNSKFLKTSMFLGLLYDIIFTNTLFLNMLLFLLVGFFIKQINIILSNNYLNVIIITVLSLLCYLISSYIILNILGVLNFNFKTLIVVIKNALFLNLFYNFLMFFITTKLSKKYKIAKID